MKMAAERQGTVFLAKSQRGSKLEINSYIGQERALGLKSGGIMEKLL